MIQSETTHTVYDREDATLYHNSEYGLTVTATTQYPNDRERAANHAVKPLVRKAVFHTLKSKLAQVDLCGYPASMRCLAG
ncbi:MAG: hypothetical protein JNL67_12780 [Planctomycetaceae bacterium]|nr:hypothetical protein [Planctomycetaceae bacterium]